jgi:MFS family permease
MAAAMLRAGPLVVLGLSTLSYVFSQLLRNATGVIGPELMRDLALSPQALGLLASVYALANAVMQVPVGLLLDRVGARRTTYALLAFAVAGTVAFALADSGMALTGARFVMGIGVSGAYVGGVVLIARWFAAERFAGVGGIFLAGGNVGALLATTPLALAAAALGWRGAFFAIAALLLPVILAGAFIIRDAPAGHSFLRRQPERIGETLRGLGIVLRDRGLQRIFLVAFINYATFSTMLGLWAGPFLNDRFGLDPVARGNVLLAMTAAVIGGYIAYGQLDRLLDCRKPLVLFGLTGMVTAFAALAIARDLALWQAVALLVALALSSAFNSVSLAHARALFPGNLVGRVATTYNLAVQLGSGVFQLVSGFVVGFLPITADGMSGAAYRLLFGFLGAAVLLALVVYLPIRDVRPSEDAAGRAGEA